eukprot:5230928-Amphidinium_carterae.3
MEVVSCERLSIRHRRDWPTPLQGRLAVNKLNFCLPLAKGHILGAMVRHSRFSAAGLFAHFCIAQHMSQSSNIPKKPQRENGASQSSIALVKIDKKSDDEAESKDITGEATTNTKVRGPASSQDDCPPTQLETYASTIDLTPTKVEKKRFCAEPASTPTKVETKKEMLALTLPVPSQRRNRRRYQARWKPIELTTEARDKLHACLSTLNSHNTAGKKHDIGIAYGEVLDFSTCYLVREASDSFKLKRTVPGTTLFCSRCGRVTPVREKFQVSNTLCPARQKSSIPPRRRASAMDDDAFMRLQQCVTELNFANTDGTRHDLGVSIDGYLDFSPCQERSQFAEGVSVKKQVPGITIFCSKCGRVAPVRERFQLAKTMCRNRPSIPLDDLLLRSALVRKSLIEFRAKKVPLSARAKAEFASLLRQVVTTLEASGINVVYQNPAGQTIQGGRAVYPCVQEGGSVVCFSSFNIGCLSNKLEGLADLPGDFFALQEVGLLHTKSPSSFRQAKSLGLQMRLGPCPTSCKDRVGRRFHNKSLGVGMVARQSLGIGSVGTSERGDVSLGTRLASFLAVKGDWRCTVHVVYFQTGNSEASRSMNHKLTTALLSRVEAHQGTPQLIAGDFQTIAYESLDLRPLFLSGWLSAAQLGDIPHTNTTPSGTTSLIDDVLLCPILATGFRRAFSTEVSGFSSHSLLTVEFESTDVDLSGWRLRIPKKTPKSEWGKIVVDLDQTSQDFWGSIPDNSSDMSSQEIYDLWLFRLNQWLGTDKVKDSASNCLKGHADYYFDDGLCARLAPKTQATNWQTQVLKKSKAWANEIHKHSERGCEGCSHCTHLRCKLHRLPLRKLAPDLCPPRPLDTQWNERLEAALQQLKRETDRKLNSWRCAIQDSVQHGTKQVFDWLKHGSMPISIVSHLGAFHVHPPHILSALKQFWEPIFCPDDHKLDPLTVQAAIASLPSAPELVLAPLTCSDFFRAAHSRTSSSAGLDGIELQELQALPEEAWTLVALLVEKVEDGHNWPWQLLE